MVVDNLSVTMAALSDPTRRSILARLASGPATVGELAGPFRISQQAISKHLACLERARLVRKLRDGRRQICTLDASPIREASDWMGRYRHLWEERLDRLDDFLRELQNKEKPHGPRKE
jgi:DNA-binding transcriptional ArsR family regulator